ncbi:unnamed protein product [Prorocentrum cordatum]|uniref:Uncharacterized protein n=1 Tax=Prorocentrum cordatum TaxID=2364126 RepID=A0ABN9RCA8_9DINO|nr:unnamed protein product [Polarella glacialis]
MRCRPRAAPGQQGQKILPSTRGGHEAAAGGGPHGAESERPAASLLDAAAALRTSACLPWGRGSTRTTTAGSGEGFPSSCSTSTEYASPTIGGLALASLRGEGISEKLRQSGGDTTPLPLAPEREDPFAASLMVRQRSLGHCDSMLDMESAGRSDDSDAVADGGEEAGWRTPPRRTADAAADGGGAVQRKLSFARGNPPHFCVAARGVPQERQRTRADSAAAPPAGRPGGCCDLAGSPQKSSLRNRTNAMGASMLNIAAYAERSGAGAASDGEGEAGAPRDTRAPPPAGGSPCRRIRTGRSNAMGASMLNISAYAEESGAGGASDGEDEDGAQRSTQPAAGWAGRRIRTEQEQCHGGIHAEHRGVRRAARRGW